MIVLKNVEQIDKIKKACRLVAEGLSKIKKMAQPGVLTLDLDTWAEGFCFDNGAFPAFKGYKDFPYTLCTSINSEIVHGLPKKSPLLEGDILSVDFGVILDGYYGDSAFTIPIGEVSDEASHLMRTGQECLYKGIKAAQEGNRLNQISHAIQSHAEDNGYTVVRKYVGHGVGAQLHEDPQIPNYTDKPTEGILLKQGMVFAIEPMILQFRQETITRRNKWTVKTEDNGLAVHWEHTVALTNKGIEVLTTRKGKEIL